MRRIRLKWFLARLIRASERGRFKMDKQGTSVEVKQTYLELTGPDDLNAHYSTDDRIRVQRAIGCPASFFRYLYTEVGRRYRWIDRLGWSDEEIRAHLAQPGVSLWVMYYDGSPAGYFELNKDEEASTELAYFGLLQEFIGVGLGKLCRRSRMEGWLQSSLGSHLHIG